MAIDSAYVPRGARRKGAAIAAGMTALLGYAVILGLARDAPQTADEAIRLFEIAQEQAPPPQPERAVPQRAPQPRPEGEAAPPNLRSEATEVVAPEPRVAIPVPPNVVAAPTPGAASDPSRGSADIAGPGTGSGGEGGGRGGGGSGEGDGAGGETPPQRIGGRIRGSDYPDALGEAGIGGTVGVRYTVARSGRVTDCAVTESSGSAELDALTCRLIRERFRFRPSRDARGRPVASIIVENHSWEVQREPPPPPPPRRRSRIFG